MIKKRIKWSDYLFKISIALLLMLTAVFPMFAIQFSLAEESTYSNVLEDLQIDESFNVEDYPVINDNYTLDVIQIAESVNKELFVYVYQPYQEYGKYTASSINISFYLHQKKKYNNFSLKLVSCEGVFQKYVVEDYVISEDLIRYYDIVSIYRFWDSNIDDELDKNTDNKIEEVVFEIAKQYEIRTGEDGQLNYAYTSTIFDTIHVVDKYVGFCRYPGGFQLFDFPDSCDVHFIAFSTDRKIDTLFDVDVYYTEQKSFYMYSNSMGITETYSKKENKVAPLNWTDYASWVGDGWFAGYYDWKTIEKMEDFKKKENRDTIYSMGIFDMHVESKLTDKALENLEEKEWVLRFASTAYKEEGGPNFHSTEKSIIGNVSILRLSFESDKDFYDLPVIDNKQTGSEDPDNNTSVRPSLPNWLKALLTFLAIVALVILLLIFAPQILIFIIQILWFVIKNLAIGIWWIITSPFSLFFDD